MAASVDQSTLRMPSSSSAHPDSQHQDLVGLIWAIADKLRGPYRPPQYRRVMLPLIVLRRLDLVLEPTKQAVLEAKAKYEAMGTNLKPHA
jgi:type I restriction-modification system DNA methylase subunit